VTVRATTPQPAPYYSTPMHLVARHPVAAFLAMVYAVKIAVAPSPLLTRRDTSSFGLAPYDSLGHIPGAAMPAVIPLPARSTYLIAAPVVAVAAVLLVVFTRGRPSYEPDRTAQPATP
jgi:hypothetical protein